MELDPRVLGGFGLVAVFALSSFAQWVIESQPKVYLSDYWKFGFSLELEKKKESKTVFYIAHITYGGNNRNSYEWEIPIFCGVPLETYQREALCLPSGARVIHVVMDHDVNGCGLEDYPGGHGCTYWLGVHFDDGKKKHDTEWRRILVTNGNGRSVKC